MKLLKNHLTLKIYFSVLMTDVTESFGELFFKKGVVATQIHHVSWQNIWVFASHLLTASNFWIGFLFYIINFVIWMAVLSRIDLSIAFPVGGATYVIVAFLSMIFLHEHITSTRWLGILCIIAGVTLISQSTRMVVEKL
ncbi:MAG: EamA family transporter [Candidatus Omnitrophica bacterium]|nr:EamA family transporter [Candidatus Omnitrophota bacterium]